MMFLKLLFSRLGNFSEELSVMDQTNGSGLTKYVMSLFDDRLVWDDIKWLKRLLYYIIIIYLLCLNYLCLHDNIEANNK